MWKFVLRKGGPHPISSLPCLVYVCIVHTCFVCVSLRVFKGLRVVLRCVCVVCLVGMFGFVSCVLVFGDANVQQQTSPFFSRCQAPSSQPWGHMTVCYRLPSRTWFFVLHVLFRLGRVRFCRWMTSVFAVCGRSFLLGCVSRALSERCF